MNEECEVELRALVAVVKKHQQECCYCCARTDLIAVVAAYDSCDVCNHGWHDTRYCSADGCNCDGEDNE